MNLSDYLLFISNCEKDGIYSEPHSQYLKLNQHRFQRWSKTYEPSSTIKNSAAQITEESKWILIVEPWCGDVAQNIPILLKIIQLIPKASIDIQLRDSNSEIESYLTNGGKAIPKVIVRDKDGKDLFTWGPRPLEAQELFLKLKNEGLELVEIQTQLHLWYSSNKGKAIEIEIAEKIKSIK